MIRGLNNSQKNGKKKKDNGIDILNKHRKENSFET